MVVLSSNDGCVVARSQEAKDLGVMMGIPYFKVRNELLQNKVTVFSSNFKLYRDISKRVMDVLHNEIGNINQYSIDEAFFNLEEDNPQVVEQILRQIKTTVEKQVGVPVSLGAGKTMTIAKYASKKEKRGSGACVLSGDFWYQTTQTVLLSEVWGVGRQTATKMREYNLHLVSDFLKVDKNQIAQIFGIHGLRLYHELKEESAHGFSERDGLQKSIMSSRSFSKSTNTLSKLEDLVAYHVTQVAEELRRKKAQASTIRVLAVPSRHGDWALRGGTIAVDLVEPTNDTRILLHEALILLRRLYETEVPYKKVGVVVGSISGSEKSQLNLFHNTSIDDNNDILMSIIDKLNKKNGHDTVTVGRIKKTHGEEINSEFISPEYTTNWRTILLVRL